MAIRMLPLNYGKGFPLDPYGMAWAARDLRGVGDSAALSTPEVLALDTPMKRYRRADARAAVEARYGPKVWAGGTGVSRFKVNVDGKPTWFRKMVRKEIKEKRASVNALASPQGPWTFPKGSLLRPPSLDVHGYPLARGRFGEPVIKRMDRRFDVWEKYQGLSGHPTLSSSNPRYAAWRGRMYGGLAGVGWIGPLVGTLISTGGAYMGEKAKADAIADQAKAAEKAANLQAKMMAAQAMADAQANAASGAGMTKTALLVGGGLAAAVALVLILRK